MKLRSKIFLIAIGVLSAVLIGFSVVVVGLMKQNNINYSTEAATAQADVLYEKLRELFMDHISMEDSEVVKDSLARYAADRLYSSNIMIVKSKSGEKLYSVSQYNPYSMFQFGEDDSEYTSKIVVAEGEHIVYIGRQFGYENEYTFFFYQNMDSVYDNIKNITYYIIGIGAFCVILTGILIAVLVKRTLRSLEVLKEGTRAMTNGEYETTIEVKTKDEFKELAERFNEMSQSVNQHVMELKVAAEKQTMLLSALTHELKTPITSIKGYSQTLLITKFPKEQEEEMLQIMDAECSRLERLSQKMMSLIMMNQENNLLLQEVSVKELLDKLQDNMKSILEPLGMTLVVECSMDTIMADEDLFLQLMINLVDNAKKASKEGDVITVCAKNHVISVTDQGKGIAKEELPKLTQPFFMVDKSRNRKNGLGLGLALCEKIATLHHASLQFESEPGQGTTVYIVWDK